MDNRYEITGTVKEIYELKQISAYFAKRKFKIYFSEMDLGNRIVERTWVLEVISPNLEILEPVRVDDQVKVKFYIDGKDYIRKDTNVQTNFTALVCYDIDIIRSVNRDTKEDKDAIITEHGKIYVEPVKAASAEDLMGLTPDPLLAAWEVKKDRYGLVDDGKGGTVAVIPTDKPTKDDKDDFSDLPF